MGYRAGIIGTGGIAGLGILGMHDEDAIGNQKFEASHAGGYLATDDIDLVAVADTDEEKRTTFASSWDLDPDDAYEDHQQMLAAEDLDVVSVCTPTLRHHDHVLDAVRIGDPGVIWCEKPIATSVTAGREMVTVCEQNDVDLLVNHSFRFTDKMVTLHDLLREEELLGELRSVTAQYRMELLRNSTHVLDTVLYLSGSVASRVGGYINDVNEAVDTLATDVSIADAGGGGFVVMEDGAFVTIDCTIPRDESSMTYQFVGTGGKLYLNNDDGEWRYWRLEDGAHVEEPLPGINGSWTWEEDYRSSFRNAAAHVGALLDGGVENRSTGAEALQSLELIVGMYLSHHTGGIIDMPLEEPIDSIQINSW